MKSRPRVTQLELAQTLGLSQTTVSRALRNSPILPADTIRKVKAAAANVGYAPDPALASLIAYRHAKRPINGGQCLGWLSHLKQGRELESCSYNRPLFEGAFERAKELGYRLEPIWTREPGMTLRRASKVLSYRKTEGIIFAPQPRPYAHFRLSLEQFSAVSVGQTLYAPCMDRVSPHHFRNMITAYRKLHGLGCRRIGLILPSNSNSRTEGGWYGAYLLEQARKNLLAPIKPLQSPEADLSALKAWLAKWKPDAVILQPEQAGVRWKQFQTLGLRIPDDFGVALLSLHAPEFREFSGIDEFVPQLGALAIDILAARLRNHEHGATPYRQVHLLEGVWKSGRTT